MSWPLEDIGSHVEKITTWNPSESGLTEEFFYIDLSSVDKDKKALELSQVQKVLAKNAPSRARQLVKASDVLVSTVRPNLNGIARIPDELNDATASTGYCVLRPIKQTLNSNYLFYWVQSNLFVNDMILKATGANYPAVSDRIIKQSKIPLPPLPKQQKIASILDAADSLRQKDQQLIEKYTALSQSLFLEMFGDPVTNPMEWDKVELATLGKISSGSTPSREINEYYEGNIPWVKTGEVNSTKIIKTSECISEEALKNSSCKLYPAGSLIIAMYGQGKTRGQVGMLGIEATTNQACAVIPPSSNMNYDYLFMLLKLSYEDLRRLGRGGNQPNLNSGLIKSYCVISPPISLQNKFGERIQVIESQKQLALASLEKSEALFNSLLQRAFKGELTA